MPAIVDVRCKESGKVHESPTEYDPDEGWVDVRTNQQQWIEFVLMCLANVAWTVDASILPVFFKQFQFTFNASQSQLTMLSAAKGWSAALFAFPCGFLAEMLPRPQLVGLGMMFWASGLGLCSVAWTYEILFLGRVLNGIGLGVVQPLLLSLVADKNAPTKRGSAIGSIFFVGGVCNTIFSQFATSFAEVEIAGVIGWRVSVMAVTIFSASIGVGIMLLVVEPNLHLLAEKRNQGLMSVFTTNIPKVWSLFKYPSFVLILMQGAPGTAPWQVFPMFTQWLEISCFTNPQAGLIWSAFGWGQAFSNLFAGYALNMVARKFPNHGPPTIANFSVAIGIPFLVLFFYVLPVPSEMGTGGGEVAAFFIAFLFFGLGAAMCGTVNKKIFADIVPASHFTYVFAIDQMVENGIGNLAGPAVGMITDKVLHYNREAITKGGCAPAEGQKLGMGMFIVCNVAWGICFCVYLGLQCTYKKDRLRQLELRVAEAKQKTHDMQQKKAEHGDFEDSNTISPETCS